MKKLCPKLFFAFAPLICVFYILMVVFVLTAKERQKENVVAITSLSETEKTNGKEPVFEESEAEISKSETMVNEALWYLVLVNYQNPLDRNPDIEFTKLSYGVTVDSRIYPDLQKMMDDARAEGLSPLICSGWRSLEDQEELFENNVKQNIDRGMTRSEAEAETEKWVAYPGTSEHQTGLAVDIVSVNNQRLDSGQENTAEQRWLMENSWKYGFILRYPKETGHITGISYEPWHYRYVGKEAAAEIFARNITLEEYLGEN